MKLTNEIFKHHWTFQAGKFILTSAPFALLLSIAFFWYDNYKNDQDVDMMISNLREIEHSLSTRYIGIFPDYLDEINLLLSETPVKDTTKVVIFEDVLFYGAFYNGYAFKEMIENLTKLATQNKRIIIAYYDNDANWRGRGRMFREVVQESWMRQSDLSKLTQDRRLLIDSLQEKNVLRNSVFRIADSIASEKYFACYRDEERKEFIQRTEKILVPLYDATKNDYQLFKQIDSIKNNYLNKPANTITFYDLYLMYQQVTDELITFFKMNKITLIPLNDYLVMSCWSNGEKVLFAFPGKFAADEIGFISHDPAILRYIDTMLIGVKVHLRNETKE
ncbi:MAG: hypothetical protein LBS55_06030 [Prevotellaceae bacterium]|jgi:hypothetical protein|nr:hypothetical protein [Prevotellaceae bacterium]